MKKLPFLLALTILSACQSDRQVAETNTMPIEPRSIFSKQQDNELFRKIAPPPQRFTLSLKRDTTITCKDGTVISIPQGGFTDAGGKVVTEDVTLEVVEALSPGDFLRNDLQTVSDGKLLQSGGMLYIDAQAAGQPLRLSDGAALNIELPASARQGDMQIFTGKYDSAGNMNWEVSEGAEVDRDLIPLPLSEFTYT